MKRDYAQAFAWYQKAADQGHADAQAYLGMFYEKGWGIKQDHKQALEWYQKAAAQGDYFARSQLDELKKQSQPYSSCSFTSSFAKGLPIS